MTMRYSLITICLWSAALLIGCDKEKTPSAATSGASGPTKTVLTLDWRPEPEFGGFYAAQIDGAFDRQNLKVDLQIAGEGAPTWQLVASGKTDFATTAADQVLIARQQGADVVALFAVYQTCPQGVMVHAARGFKTLGDVFTHPGVLSAENNAWLSFCQKKFSPIVVTMTALGGGVPVFAAKPDYSMQCFVTSEPIEAKKLKSDPQTFLIAEAGYNPYTTVVITRGEVIRSQPQLVKGMFAACREGWTDYLKDPSAANVAMGKLNPQMDAATFAAAAEAQLPLIQTEETAKNGLGTMTLTRWKDLAQQLKDLAILKGTPSPEQCYVDVASLK